MNLYEELCKDYRFREGLHTCINCGTCTAICPAAEFYRYDPRKIVDIVQRKNEGEIEALLKSDTIWYCGECMSCSTRCPRTNTPGLVIMALRAMSIRHGYFTASEKGRQVYPLTKMLTGNILNYGYCVYPETFDWKYHQESGPVFKWHLEHLKDDFERIGANYQGTGPGVLRKIPQADRDELKAIFDETGATDRINLVEMCSKAKAEEMGMTMEDYRKHTLEYNSGNDFDK